MAKDAKGHGSEKRGGSGKLEARSISEIMHAPEYGSPIPYGATKVAAIAAAHGIPIGHLGSGPYKVQSLALERAGKPWATTKAYGNKVVAETVAQHMRQDGGYTRVR